MSQSSIDTLVSLVVLTERELKLRLALQQKYESNVNEEAQRVCLNELGQWLAVSLFSADKGVAIFGRGESQTLCLAVSYLQLLRNMWAKPTPNNAYENYAQAIGALLLKAEGKQRQGSRGGLEELLGAYLLANAIACDMGGAKLLGNIIGNVPEEVLDNSNLYEMLLSKQAVDLRTFVEDLLKPFNLVLF